MEKRLKLIIVLVLAVVSVAYCVGLFEKNRSNDKNIALVPIALAEASFTHDTFDGILLVKEEAGISAYVNIGKEIDLNKVKDVIDSIEVFNESYVIGQIEIDNYDPSIVAPHVYISRDGWIMAYFWKDEPSSKIMDWENYHGGLVKTTTLANAIKRICNTLESGLYDKVKHKVSYYDFEFPDANRMMLITKWIPYGHKIDKRAFYLTIPNDCQLYEASWSHYIRSNGQHWEGKVYIRNSSSSGFTLMKFETHYSAGKYI